MPNNLLIFKTGVQPLYCVPCCFQYLLPNENCKNPGVTAEATIFAVRLIHADALLRFVVTSGPGSDGYTQNGSTMWRIREGTIDVTAPFFNVIYARRNLSFAAATPAGRRYFILKKIHRLPSLNPTELVEDPIGLWFGMLTCFFAWQFSKFLFGKYFSRHGSKLVAGSNSGVTAIYSQEMITDNCKIASNVGNISCLVLESMYRKLRVNLGFWRGFFTNAVGSYVMIVFLRNANERHPIYNRETFRREIISGRYTAVFSSYPSYMHYYDDPKVRQSEDLNPPVILDEPSKINKYFSPESFDSGRKYVTVNDMQQTKEIMSKFCDIDVVEDETSFEQRHAVFHRDGFELRYSHEQVKLITREIKRLFLKYSPRKLCPEKSNRQGPYEIAFHQFRGLFMLMVLFLTFSVSIFVLESAFMLWAKRFTLDSYVQFMYERVCFRKTGNLRTKI